MQIDNEFQAVGTAVTYQVRNSETLLPRKLMMLRLSVMRRIKNVVLVNVDVIGIGCICRGAYGGTPEHSRSQRHC